MCLRGILHAWIRRFLDNRPQLVEINSSISNNRNITCIIHNAKLLVNAYYLYLRLYIHI